MKKLWSVKFTSRDGRHATLTHPTWWPVAVAQLLFSPEYLGWKRAIVNHDKEVRAWGRHDWVMFPTEDDRRSAMEGESLVIPVLKPNESIVLKIRSPESGSSYDASKQEGEAK